MGSNMLKCLVIDDDPLITDLLQHYCSKVDAIEYCLTCNNSIDGLQLLSNQQFDLLFLDYNMPSLDGKGLLELKQDKSKVIMVTSNAAFAVESYNYPNIVDFLLKPISFDRFYKAIEKLIEKPTVASEKSTKESFFVKDGNKWIQVRTEEILYIKSESNYVILYLEGKKIMSLLNLKDLETELPDHFFRTHRSYIVNSKFIDFISADEMSVLGVLIPISTKYKDSLKALLP
jgi:DNA-binding LytR/AlgR family response regulator